MSLSELCIRRPVMTTLLMLSFIVFGIFGYTKLPVAALPRVDFPTISVFSSLPGAGPETMASSVAAPLERAFATIPGITTMTSTSANGSTNITMQFDLDRNIDGAALDVQSQISATLRKLPPQLPAPPSFKKVNPADSPILFLALSSATLPLATVDDYAEQIFAQQISQVPGVAQVQIFGQQKFAVRIQADPDKVSALGLTLNDVGNAVAAANSSAPVGALLGQKQNISLDATGQLTHAEPYEDLVVSWRNGAPVHLREVAHVTDSVENDQVAAWYGNQRAIVLAIFRQSDANTVDVIDNVRARIPRYEAQLPPAIETHILSDRSVSIRASVADVERTLMVSIVLVVLVIFFFLKTASATLIPALALPVSLIGTFAVMYMFGYSIDNISLLAITLAVGFVVDDAIVMLENIHRHIETGMRPFAAALKGASEIGFTILSITLSLVAVFIPVLLMAGVVGRVFREFAVTISVAILVSGFVSLTLTPMLCARILVPVDHSHRQGLFSRFSDTVINTITNFYRTSLDLVLRARLLVLFLTIATAFLTVQMYINIPKGFFPTEDTSFLRGSTEGPTDTSVAAMAERQKQVVDIVVKDPAVEYATSAIGFGGVNQGFLFIAMKPKAQRGSQEDVMIRLRKSTAAVPGITTILQPVQNLVFNGGRPTRALYQYTLQSSDLDALYSKSPEMLDKLRAIPSLQDVNTDLKITNPEVIVDIDRLKAAAYGISADDVRTALYSAFGTRQISTIFTQASDYQVILEASRHFQDDPAAIGRIYVRASVPPSGSTVAASGGSDTRPPILPLAEVADVRRAVAPLTVNRQSQQPAVTLSFNLTPGVSIGQAVEAIRAAEREVNLPASISTNFAGTAALFQDAQQGQAALIVAAVLTIYIVLGVLYESYIHPITILSGLPSAGMGALLALEYFNLPLTVIAIIGILLLVGIVKKNAIMMVDFALVRRRDGLDALPAIREAALIRFRPIIMTTLAAILGAVPIALGAGDGAELRQPLGIAIVGGLCVSQILTLYITPVIYYYLDKIDTFLSGRRSRGEATPEDIPGMAGAHPQPAVVHAVAAAPVRTAAE
jgi:hydrophobic/amphiphilic exporter-1 (mainly G- bacteria), HAE1 family